MTRYSALALILLLPHALYAGKPPAHLKKTCGIWYTDNRKAEMLRVSIRSDSVVFDVEDDLGRWKRAIAMPIAWMEVGPKGWSISRKDSSDSCRGDTWVRFQLHGVGKATWKTGRVVFCNDEYNDDESYSNEISLRRSKR